MKKILSLLLIVLLVLMLAACGGGNREAGNETEGESNAPPAGEGLKEGEPTYKEKMVPYNQLEPSERIVFLQNALNFSREGFYTAETKPQTKAVSYQNDSVEAYSMDYVLAFLSRGVEGEVTVTKTDGSTVNLAADDLAGMYVILDFTSGEAPVLYNPASGTEVTDFFFAVTAAGEAIYSVVSDSVHNAAEILNAVGWNENATYRYVATDKFYIPVGPQERAKGEIRGTLSGAINVPFPIWPLPAVKSMMCSLLNLWSSLPCRQARR